MTNFTKGQIVKNSLDTVINYEIKRIVKNNCVGGVNLICRSFSKYGEHGTVEIHESNVTI